MVWSFQASQTLIFIRFGEACQPSTSSSEASPNLINIKVWEAWKLQTIKNKWDSWDSWGVNSKNSEKQMRFLRFLRFQGLTSFLQVVGGFGTHQTLKSQESQESHLFFTVFAIDTSRISRISFVLNGLELPGFPNLDIYEVWRGLSALNLLISFVLKGLEGCQSFQTIAFHYHNDALWAISKLKEPRGPPELPNHYFSSSKRYSVNHFLWFGMKK